jgi:SAM-dependent methyltransferase
MQMQVHMQEKNWVYEPYAPWVGGHHPAPNSTEGFHGILKQWWEYYGQNKKNWLLVCENDNVKKMFQSLYLDSNFRTLSFFDDMNKGNDLIFNLCQPIDITNKFDMVICQAIFEHLYDPVMAMRNLINLTASDGSILIHTHTPGFFYHPWPRDYLRFYPDWFLDVQKFLGGVTLKELCNTETNIFAVFKKN